MSSCRKKKAAGEEARKNRQVLGPPLSHIERIARNVLNAVDAVRSRPALLCILAVHHNVNTALQALANCLAAAQGA